jgi:LGFP repeat
MHRRTVVVVITLATLAAVGTAAPGANAAVRNGSSAGVGSTTAAAPKADPPRCSPIEADTAGSAPTGPHSAGGAAVSEHLATLALDGADPARITQETGLTEVSYDDGGVRPASALGSVTTTPPSVYKCPDTGLFWAVSTFTWNNQTWHDDLDRLRLSNPLGMGDFDGFAINFDQPIEDYTDDSLVQIKPSAWWVPKGGTTPSFSYYHEEKIKGSNFTWDHGPNGVSYKFQDGTYDTPCGVRDIYCTQFNSTSGVLVFEYRPKNNGCLSTHSLYEHTWSDTKITGFSVGIWDFGVQWENGGNSIPSSSPTTHLPGCGDPIEEKYYAMGGPNSTLGRQLTGPQDTPDKLGMMAFFENGAIYWTPQTGAHAIWGYMLQKWDQYQRERGPLGYPITDVLPVSGTDGQYIDFQHGTIDWSPGTGVHNVWGLIFNKYVEKGRETGPLGFPATDESDTAHRDGR